jgi:hypothetical protein
MIAHYVIEIFHGNRGKITRISAGFTSDHNIPGCVNIDLIDFLCLMPLSAIYRLSWRPVLVVEEAEVPGKKHRPWASKW